MDEIKHNLICKTYRELRDRVRTDPEYARLQQMLADLEPQYEAILDALPEPDRLVLDRYVTLREAMGSRLLEYACGELCPPDISP